MKKDLFHISKLFFCFCIFLLSYGAVWSGETPFIPKKNSIKPVIPYETDLYLHDGIVLQQPMPAYYQKRQPMASYSAEWTFSAPALSNIPNNRGAGVFGDFFRDYTVDGIFVEKRGHETPSVYIRTAARYFDISGDAITSSLTGGLSAGFYIGLDRYMDTGVIDVVSSLRSAALMSGSGYIGLNAGNFAANKIISPIFGSALGSTFVNTVGSAAGGAASGFLFAAGAYAFGSIDRHTARLMVAKSLFGSAASAGITAIIGTSTITTGIFAVGTFAMPFITALGAGYLVDKFFEFVDKQEEKERIELLLEKII